MGDEQPHPEPARRRWAPMSKIPKSLLSRTSAQRADPGPRASAPMPEHTPAAAAPARWVPDLRRLRRLVRESGWKGCARRSEEHTSELQSLMRTSYAVFCLKKKNKTKSQ